MEFTKLAVVTIASQKGIIWEFVFATVPESTF